MASEAPLTASVLADALECFWNAAIGDAHARQAGMDAASVVATGFAAVAARLKEHAALPHLQPTAATAEVERDRLAAEVARVERALSRAEHGHNVYEVLANYRAIRRDIQDRRAALPSSPRKEGSGDA
jgi:hypothetical protein